MTKRRKASAPKAPAAAKWQERQRLEVEYAAATLIGTGQLESMFIVHLRDGRAMLVRSTGDRAHDYLTAKMVCIAADPEALSMIAEGWVRRLTKRAGETEAELDARGREIAPSEAEDRIEAVIDSIFYRDDAGMRQALTAIREIERGDDGRPTGLREVDDLAAMIGGAALDIFPEERPSQEEREIARIVIEQMGLLT